MAVPTPRPIKPTDLCPLCYRTIDQCDCGVLCPRCHEYIRDHNEDGTCPEEGLDNVRWLNSELGIIE